MKISWVVIPLALGAMGQTWAFASFGVGLAKQLFCNTDEIRSDFSSPAQVSYRARGFCSMKEARQHQPTGTSTFDNYNNATELYRFNWTSTGSYNPTTKATRETIEAPPPRIDEPSPPGRPYGRFTLETICDIDPWLKITSLRCAPAKTAFTGNLSAEVQKMLGHSSVPFTSNMSFAMRDVVRAAQRKEDERRAALARTTPTLAEARATPGATTLATATTAPATLGKRKRPVTNSDPSMPTGGAGGSTAPSSTGTVSAAQDLQAALAAQRAQQQAAAVPTGGAGGTRPDAAAPVAAPTPTSPAVPPPSTATPAQLLPQIVSPPPGAPQHAGYLRVQVKPTPGSEAQNAEVEFVWLAPRPNVQGDRPPTTPMPLTLQAPMARLMEGLLVPINAGPSTSGRWQMRVHALGAGAAWSAPLVFDFSAAENVAAAGGPQPQPQSQARAWVRERKELERRGLNPQPLPPRDAELQRRGLNPQPLPPKDGSTTPRSAFERTQ